VAVPVSTAPPVAFARPPLQRNSLSLAPNLSGLIILAIAFPSIFFFFFFLDPAPEVDVEVPLDFEPWRTFALPSIDLDEVEVETIQVGSEARLFLLGEESYDAADRVFEVDTEDDDEDTMPTSTTITGSLVEHINEAVASLIMQFRDMQVFLSRYPLAVLTPLYPWLLLRFIRHCLADQEQQEQQPQQQQQQQPLGSEAADIHPQILESPIALAPMTPPGIHPQFPELPIASAPMIPPGELPVQRRIFGLPRQEEPVLIDLSAPRGRGEETRNSFVEPGPEQPLNRMTVDVDVGMTSVDISMPLEAGEEPTLEASASLPLRCGAYYRCFVGGVEKWVKVVGASTELCEVEVQDIYHCNGRAKLRKKAASRSKFVTETFLTSGPYDSHMVPDCEAPLGTKRSSCTTEGNISLTPRALKQRRTDQRLTSVNASTPERTGASSSSGALPQEDGKENCAARTPVPPPGGRPSEPEVVQARTPQRLTAPRALTPRSIPEVVVASLGAAHGCSRSGGA